MRCKCRSECGQNHGVSQCHRQATADGLCAQCVVVAKSHAKPKPARNSPRLADTTDDLPLFKGIK